MRGDNNPDFTDIKRIIKKYYLKIYGNKFDSLDEMEKFLETYKVQEEIRT